MLENRIAVLEAERDRLRKSLEDIVRHLDITNPTLGPLSTMYHIALVALHTAGEVGE
jgi:hypothetical protein